MSDKQDLRDFHAIHDGETLLVCGCGISLAELPRTYAGITIGVNDVGRHLDPTYLVVLNPRRQFTGDRFEYVEKSRARAIFTQLDLGLCKQNLVRFRLGERGGTDLSRMDRLPYTRNSTYVALCLALFMGAKRIGLIGVDFTDHHFFARTGKHALSDEIDRINAEFSRLGQRARERGVEILNLSPASRITAFEKAPLGDFIETARERKNESPQQTPGVFFVDYRFKTCGDIFGNGLSYAAQAMGLRHTTANWDDPKLAGRIDRFDPDLLFVVHGRQFIKRWGRRIRHRRTAVWLLDEPYEVDDSAVYSRYFDTVFLNDHTTRSRHENAHYLPVAFDPRLHRDQGAERDLSVGFIGGANPQRERMLSALQEAGLLSYLVGGPWRSRALNRLCLSPQLAPHEVARLYGRSRIVVNVFRDRHHYNRLAMPAHSLNPRIYEALACGAAVVSEARPELAQVFPELPVFSDPQTLVACTASLLADPAAMKSLLEHSRARLAAHSYQQRLERVLEVCMSDHDYRPAPRAESLPAPVAAAEPSYAILMVVHDACDMVKLSTLCTLQYCEGESARLFVVDNGSSDGVEDWLGMLSARGDIELIRTGRNIGHGPGLELAREKSRSACLVTLDSDAFPLRKGWLEALHSRLDDHVLVAGIRHHRDYVHPACLMIGRATMDDQGLTFLDEKHLVSRLDVGERISVALKERGYAIAGLERTGQQRRGSRSEPIYLGSAYEGIVYHQWYTTRSVLSGEAPVDDVPRSDLDRSLTELLEAGQRERRDVAVIIGVRDDPAAPERLQNVRAVIERINLQTMARWRYRVVLVEQDTEPRLQRSLSAFVDQYRFVFNPGAYNRGWGFNVGARLVGESVEALCLLDADLLVPEDFLVRGQAALAAGAAALQPYSEILYLDKASTQRLHRQCAAQPLAFPATDLAGRSFRDSAGGCLWVTPRLYRELGGHDERFEGWGYEDREFLHRLSRHARVARSPERLLHLYHRTTGEGAPEVAVNERRLQEVTRRSLAPWSDSGFGDPDRYRTEAVKAGPRRDWEHWATWSEQRIEAILAHKTLRGGDPRKRLVDLAATLGNTLLDLGCGPGTLCPYAEVYSPFVQWRGIDVTGPMLNVAKRHFPHLPLIQGDAAALPLGDGACDVLIMRHLLEHLPAEVVARTLAEAMRVAKNAVVIAFYKPPRDRGGTVRHRVGEGFIETLWSGNELLDLIAQAGGRLVHRHVSHKHGTSMEELWFLEPDSTPETGALKPMPLVSIVMPFYRRRHTLDRALSSIMAQRYRNWELIIVDNEGVVGLAFDDPRIRVVRHDERASASYARNRGLGYARGELVCFFDDDDKMFPDYLAVFVEAFQANPQAKLVRVGMRKPNGRTDYSHATPECCLRRVHASPTWTDEDYVQDQHYFERIISARGWRTDRGELVTLRKVLCQAYSDRIGGLRAGAL